MLFAARVRALREIYYNLSLFLFSNFTTFLWNRYSHPLMIYFLVVCQKGPERENFGLVHTWAYTECRNSKLEAETGAP